MRLGVLDDPQSFTVRQVDQLPSILGIYARDAVKRLYGTRILRIAQIQQPYGLRGSAALSRLIGLNRDGKSRANLAQFAARRYAFNDSRIFRIGDIYHGEVHVLLQIEILRPVVLLQEHLSYR